MRFLAVLALSLFEHGFYKLTIAGVQYYMQPQALVGTSRLIDGCADKLEDDCTRS